MDDQNADDEPEKKKTKKKKGKSDTPNLNMLIQDVLDDKAEDAALRNQVRAAVQGVDSSTIAKATYGHWLSTILPRIRDIDFDYFTYENNKLTLEYLNRARLNLPPADPSLRDYYYRNMSPRPQKMSTTGNLSVTEQQSEVSKPATVSVAPPDTSSNYEDITPPRPAPVPEPTPGPSHQHRRSSYAMPSNGHDGRVPDAGYPSTCLPGQPVYPHHQRSIPSYGDIVAVRGTASPQHNVSNDNNESQIQTYTEMQPVQLMGVQNLETGAWDTFGPPAPGAVMHSAPETPIRERLQRLAQECQEAALDLTPSPKKTYLNRTPVQDE